MTGLPWLDVVLVAGALVTALGVLWRATRPGRRLAGAVGDFLSDWNGEPGRPGRPATPPFPERLSRIEAQLVELPPLAVGVEQLHNALAATSGRVASLDDRLALIDRRVTDHRRRNDRQVELLRQEVELRLGQLAALRGVLGLPPLPTEPIDLTLADPGPLTESEPDP